MKTLPPPHPLPPLYHDGLVVESWTSARCMVGAPLQRAGEDDWTAADYLAGGDTARVSVNPGRLVTL